MLERSYKRTTGKEVTRKRSSCCRTTVSFNLFAISRFLINPKRCKLGVIVYPTWTFLNVTFFGSRISSQAAADFSSVCRWWISACSLVRVCFPLPQDQFDAVTKLKYMSLSILTWAILGVAFSAKGIGSQSTAVFSTIGRWWIGTSSLFRLHPTSTTL